MDKLQFVIPTLFGLEGPVGDELRRLDLSDVRGDNAKVYATGTAKDIARINLNLRCGERVLIQLGTFMTRDFDSLFEGTKALPWEEFIPKDGQFPVKGYTLDSQLSSEPACQSIIKKAVATRLGQAYGMNTLPETGSLYQIQFALLKDRVALFLDTSGVGLHKRGYRENKVLAPLRETLAAALVILSRYKGKDLFWDPHCGSGTILIEAALIARNKAPGLDRSFAAQKWRWLPGEAWTDAVEEAMDKEFRGHYEIHGSDIDPHAVKVARQNASRAEVDGFVRFHVGDSGRFTTEETRGRMVTNPPYGERLLEVTEAEELYRNFGRATEKLGDGWQIGILTPHSGFETAFGRKADKERKLYNGKLKCRFYQYNPNAPGRP